MSSSFIMRNLIDCSEVSMKKTILLLTLLFLSPFPALADDSPNTLTRQQNLVRCIFRF